MMDHATTYLARRPTLSPRARTRILSIARRLPPNPTPADLDHYLASIAHLRPATIATHARILAALARHARLPWCPPRISQTLDAPTAWTPDDVARILHAAAHHPPRTYWTTDPAAYWTTLIATAYYTAARIGTLLALPWTAWQRPHLLAPATTTKARRYQLWRLPDDLADRLDALPRDADTLWPAPRRPNTIHRALRRLLATAGLDPPRTPRQLWHRLRRSAITALANTDPIAAARLAGHADPRTTYAHYIDPRLLAPPPAPPPVPLPPRLRIYS